jgi:WS/DGAT/MGAT family acyltransferase
MSFSERLNLSEFAWTALESRNRPMHVATLLIYALPEGANDAYLTDLVSSLRDSTEFVDPFNKKFVAPSFLRPYPTWVRDYDLDMEYHVRHLALPAPGGERELGALIARLHSNPLDFKRPLWEYHIIEGLENNRFAIYFKMHHALVDGIAGVHMLTRSMSTDPTEMRSPALWSAEPPATASDTEAGVSRLQRATKGAVRSLTSINNVSRSLLQVARAARDENDPFSLPFQSPKSILNGRIGSQRRFATQAYAFSRIRRLSKIAGCTVNDIVLAVSSGALRRFLREINALPGRSLTAGVPVSLRPKDDQGAGAAVAFIIANLATHVADPVRRLEVIAKSTTRAKTLMAELSREEIENFSALMLSPQSLQTVFDLEGYTRPVFNVTVSNVPGPTETLYLRGSQLEAMFPVSAVTHGQALNITCYSYGGNISFGFAGCRDSVPHLQRIAVYTGEALEELEAVLLPLEKPQVNEVAEPASIKGRKKVRSA